MKYKILCTEIDDEDGDRLIKIRDRQKRETFYYYTSEVKIIGESVLKTFLLKQLNEINNGSYDY